MKALLKKCLAAVTALTVASTTAVATYENEGAVVVEAKKLSAKQQKKIAKKYVGKPINALVRKIGRYKRGQVSASCNSAGYYEGLYQWKGFKVKTRSKSKSKSSVQIIKAVK